MVFTTKGVEYSKVSSESPLVGAKRKYSQAIGNKVFAMVETR